MDSFELNKLIGAFLGVVFVVFSVSLASDALFASHAPETPGYVIEVPEEPAGGGAPVDAGPTAFDLLATADPAAGEAAFRRCASCHTIEAGGANRVGPNLHGVLGRVVAEEPGFSYSAAMEAYSEDATRTWEFENLSAFLVNPRGYVSGTTMAFAGIRDPQEEANLLVWMNQQSDSPLPIPEPAAEEPAAEGDDATPAGDAATESGEETAPAAATEGATGEDLPAPGNEAPASGDGSTGEELPATGGETPAATPGEDATGTDAGDAPAGGQETEATPAAPDVQPRTGDQAAPTADPGTPAADGDVIDGEQRIDTEN